LVFGPVMPGATLPELIVTTAGGVHDDNTLTINSAQPPTTALTRS